ncbi:tRNA-dihydrouridine synthase [Bacillus pacificus]
MLKKYGIDGVMIGRGIFKNPFAFEKEPREHSSKEHLDLLRLQLDLPRSICRSITTLYHRTTSLLQNLCKRLPGAAELRNQLMSTKSTDEVRTLLNQFEASVSETQGSETV